MNKNNANQAHNISSMLRAEVNLKYHSEYHFRFIHKITIVATFIVVMLSHSFIHSFACLLFLLLWIFLVLKLSGRSTTVTLVLWYCYVQFNLIHNILTSNHTGIMKPRQNVSVVSSLSILKTNWNFEQRICFFFLSDSIDRSTMKVFFPFILYWLDWRYIYWGSTVGAILFKWIGNCCSLDGSDRSQISDHSIRAHSLIAQNSTIQNLESERHILENQAYTQRPRRRWFKMRFWSSIQSTWFKTVLKPN